jgi:hypothetical protein
MRLSFNKQDDADALDDRPQPEPQRDWSHVVLMASIVMSLSMVAGTFCVRFGMQLAEGNRLKKQGVALCADLRHPPNVETRDPAILDECAQLVDRHHSACLDVARAEHPKLKQQRYSYTACVMSAWPVVSAGR